MFRIMAALLIACLIGLTACSNTEMPRASTSPALPISDSALPTGAEDIVARTLSAMNQVGSYEFETDVVYVHKDLSQTAGPANIVEWKGSKLVDLPTRQMAMNMTISGLNYRAADVASLEMYFKDGSEYLKSLAPGLSQPNPWTKSQLTDALWNSETQISYLSTILKTSAQLNFMGNEKVNGVDCYVLNISPAVHSMIDLEVSQQQPFGPQLDIMWGGAVPVVRADAYQGSSLKFWISQAGYLPLKVEFNADFEGNVGGGPLPVAATPYTPATSRVSSSFQGLMHFSNYGRPLTIQLPAEALKAIEH